MDAAADDGATLRDVLLQTVARRTMALGSFYTDLRLTDEQLRGAKEDVRLARTWEQQRVCSAMRRAELNAQRQVLLESERQGAASVAKQMGVRARELRARAMTALEAEAAAAEALLQATEQTDQRRLLQQHNNAERSIATTTTTTTTPAASTKTREMASVPRVVLNIDVGSGSIDRLVLRDGDDVDELAAAFVRRHGLPQHTVRILAAQAREALEEQHH
ncbi:hypothetical protein DQ04_16871000 [Trypanosoma grayi]|uniref:hypothetical protein n=1 Tax=Trypanosoma grayi TaxID=71804 RepID=UPI0004F3F16E|nr:hypothetical protein DQ04_16871000 [Trypanosoma grayi]KEG05974.1 hypothetical protein DQ04_16871000 [Trypanosoma grayi]